MTGRRWPALLLLAGLVALALAAGPVGADGAQVTSGSFQTYAAGLDRGYDIAGLAVMVRTADGQTIVTTHASGLAPNRTYGTHVHNLPCGVSNGGGHYQDVPGGPVDPVNEIWPMVGTNAAGVGQGSAMNDFTARPEAQAIVIHDADGARIACADLS
jgi:hypothetical protein